MLGWELPPHNSGGLGVACLSLCKALSFSGADIEFVIPFHTSPNFGFMKVTSSIQVNEESDVSEYLKTGFGAYDSFMYFVGKDQPMAVSLSHVQSGYERTVETIAKLGEFNIIHAHDWLTFRAAVRAKEVTGLPLIVHIHSIERDRAAGAQGNPLVREIEYLGLHIADKIIAVSDRVKRMIVTDYGIPADKIEVIHNSIEFDDNQSGSLSNCYEYLSLMKNSGWKVVANVGRLTIQKGLPNLLESAAQVVKHEPKTFFLFVGNGEQRDELIMQSAQLGIADRVIFTGFLRGQAWRDTYKIADLFVMPSVSEPFGLTPLESIGYGTPVLISKQSGVAEVLSTCLKVDFWDTLEMANKIVGLLRNDALSASLRDNGYTELKNFSWDTSARKTMGVYNAHLAGAMV